MAKPLSLPDGVAMVTGPGGLQQLRVVTSACEGQLELYGAHVTGWTPAGARPVVWVSPNAIYAKGTAIRGGIPICAPWFGPGLSGDRTPAHGWMRTALWQLEAVTAQGDDISATLTLDGRELFAGDPILARYTVTFGHTLRSELALTALEPQTVEAALHTYLAVDDVRRIAVTGLEGAPYIERAAGQHVEGRDEQPIRFTGELDRIYASAAPVAVLDPDLERRLLVTKEGSATTVVWNPAAEKAAAMKDMTTDGWTHFVCVETANAQAGAVALSANTTMTIAATLSVAPWEQAAA